MKRAQSLLEVSYLNSISSSSSQSRLSSSFTGLQSDISKMKGQELAQVEIQLLLFGEVKVQSTLVPEIQIDLTDDLENLLVYWCALQVHGKLSRHASLMMKKKSSNSAIEMMPAPASSSAAMVDASPVAFSPVKVEETKSPVSNSSIYIVMSGPVNNMPISYHGASIKIPMIYTQVIRMLNTNFEIMY
uniref:Uncharacterized protein n=1 Tax=Ditylenchus dipsaci TaxID=166011 RepID=A0A915EE89_9BILA